MQEITVDLLEDHQNFELICLPCSLYQKKNDGEIVTGKKGIMFDFCERFEGLNIKIGEGITKFGSVPYPCYTVDGSKIPTKICGFPMTPSNMRAEDPSTIVYNRFKNRFKPFSLLPGFFLAPRSDSLEFSCIKLKEVITYYKLTKVAIPFEGFAFGEGDDRHIDRVKKILYTHLDSNVYLTNPIKETIEAPVKSEVKDEDSE